MLRNKVILITGSTNGIGAVTARLCVARGAKVMIHGRQKDCAEALISELGKDSAHYLIADLADEHSYPYLITETVKRFGTLHGLVNNAGIYPRNNIDSANSVLCAQIMQVNFYAPLFLCQAAVKVFRENGNGGAIVNIGSMNAYCGQTDLLLYSCSKGALMTMTRNLADSLGPDRIRVNQLNVGWTPTDHELVLKRKEGLPDDWQDRIPKTYAPSGRLLSPENVSEHVIFWLSDQSRPVTAAIYEVEQYPIIGRNRINDLVIT